MYYPRILINNKKIKENTTIMVKACKDRGISVAGVTKVFCGNPEIAQAFIDGGVELLADSRIENLRKLEGLPIAKMLLRIPPKSRAADVVRYADISLVSEPSTVEELSKEAIKQEKDHSIIIMVDLGDLREGIYFENEIFEAVSKIIPLEGISLKGIGTNLSCYGGVIPTKDNLSRLLEIRRNIEDRFQISLPLVSGGNSGVISLFQNNEVPSGINQLRLGAALAMGIGLNDEPIHGLHQDAFKLHVEIIEIREKPSLPVGKIGLDAFGKKPSFKDKGVRRRAICNIGKQDISPDNLMPLDKDIEILGASSDHLILDITETENAYKIGDILTFNITYGGCLSAMTSEYVYKALI